MTWPITQHAPLLIGDNGDMSQPARRRPSHLLDLDNLPVRTVKDDVALTKVQTWVLSTLAVSTIMHMAGALIIFGISIDADKPGSRYGLMAIAALFGIVGVAAGRLIHRVSPFSLWLLTGTLPALFGVWWIAAR